jgi:hypothetical protein
MIENYVRLRINTGDNYKTSTEKRWICRDVIEITAFAGIYEKPVSVYFVSEVQITQSQTVTLVKFL